jgi:hypothetical protein
MADYELGDDCRCRPMKDGLCVCCRAGLEAEADAGFEHAAAILASIR